MKLFRGPKRLTFGDYLITGLLLLFALFILFPIWYVLTVSLVNQTTFIQVGLLWYPVGATLENYFHIAQWQSLRTGMWTSTLVAVGGTFYTLALNVSFAYGLLRPIPGRKILWTLLIIPMFFGGGLLPYFLMMINLGMMNNRLALVLPFGLGVFNVFLLQSYMRTLSPEYEESARLDGASELMVLVRIVLPLCKPILATLALFAAVGGWNRWFEGTLFLQRQELWPLQQVLRNILENAQIALPDLPHEARNVAFAVGLQMAAVILTMIPIVCVYPFLQKYFVKGITLGGVKG